MTWEEIKQIMEDEANRLKYEQETTKPENKEVTI